MKTKQMELNKTRIPNFFIHLEHEEEKVKPINKDALELELYKNQSEKVRN